MRRVINVKLIDKIALLYIVDGKILSTRSKGKDTYYLPGGSADLCRFERKRTISLKYLLT